MGKILLCIQNKVHDVNSTLAMHNVHPQVRADVARRLSGLIFQVQEYVETLNPAYGEVPEKICGVFAREIVEKAVNTIPLVELATTKSDNLSLELRARRLEVELKKSEELRLKAEAMLERFRAIHDNMLHSYFREVLILRHQLHDSMMMVRHGRLGRMITLQSVPQEHMSAALRTGTRIGTGVPQASDIAPREKAEESMDGAPSGSMCLCGGDCVIFGPPESTDSLTGTTPPSDNYFPHLGAAGEDRAVPDRSASPHSACPVHGKRQGERLLATHPPGMSHQASACARRALGDKEDAKVELIPSTVSVATQTVEALYNDPVNAIFDYEEYIRKFMLEGLLGEAGGMLARRISSPGLKDEAARKALAEFLARGSVDESFLVNDGACDADTLGVKAGKFEMSLKDHCLVLQLQCAKLRCDLDDVRRSIQELANQYMGDITQLDKMFQIVQSRVAHLLSFFGVYTGEVLKINEVLEEVLGVFSRGVPQVTEKGWHTSRVVADYFTPRSSYNPAALVHDDTSDANADNPDIIDRRAIHKNEFGYWEDNRVVQQAKKAFAKLQRTGFRLYKKRAVGSSMRPWDTGADPNRGLLSANDGVGESDGAGGSGDQASSSASQRGYISTPIDENDEDEYLASLSREELLKLLVQRRLRRVSTRARLSNTLARLARGVDECFEVERLQRILNSAGCFEQKVNRTSRTIEKILKLLNLPPDGVDDVAYFTKDLAFSPYLINPTGTYDKDGEEIVLMQVPMRSSHAQSLRNSLMDTNFTGYVVFNDEVIPIARGMMTSSDYQATRSSSCRSLRPRSVYVGSGLNYPGNARLNRPLGDATDFANICLDLSEYGEGAEQVRMPTAETRPSFHVSTLTIPKLCHSPQGWHSCTTRIGSSRRSVSALSRALTVDEHPAPQVLAAKNICGMRTLPARVLKPLRRSLVLSDRAQSSHPEVHQGNARDKHLLVIESLTLRQKDSEARRCGIKEPNTSIGARVGSQSRYQRLSSPPGSRLTISSSTGCLPGDFLRFHLPGISQEGPSQGN